MQTELVAKLPKVKVYHLKVIYTAKDNLSFSSLDRNKLLTELHKHSDWHDFRIFDSMVANTWESDENHHYDTLASFKNFIK